MLRTNKKPLEVAYRNKQLKNQKRTYPIQLPFETESCSVSSRHVVVLLLSLEIGFYFTSVIH